MTNAFCVIFPAVGVCFPLLSRSLKPCFGGGVGAIAIRDKDGYDQTYGSTILNLSTAYTLDSGLQLGIESAEQVSYEALLRSSDIVTFHVPGGTGTKEMFSAREVALVQNHALIINTARGSIVEFRDVTEAVKKSQIGAYASDVFPVEPLISTNYSIESGFYFSPHIGGNADEAILAMGRAAIRGLKEFWT